MEKSCEYNFKTNDFENATRRDVSTIKKFTTNNNYEKLYPHQRRAVKFLYNCYLKTDGCVLDHDKSMGKTVDVCVFLDLALRTTDTALILCSEELLLFWLYHIHKWTGLKATVIKKNEDLHKQSHLKQIALVNVRLCNKLTTHAWKIIVLDNADETINFRGFRGYCQKQLSFNIALTNVKLQRPSNRTLLWTILHNFVCPNFKLTKKDFLTNCTCTLEELLWCPWKDYYSRMGWMSHCNTKPLINPKDFENDFYIWRKNYISGKIVEPVELSISKDKNIIIKENFEDKLENLVAPKDGNMKTEHESETKNIQPEVKPSTLIETPYFIEVNGELCSPKYIEVQKMLKIFYEIEKNNILVNNDANCKTVNENCDNSKPDTETCRKPVSNFENSKNNAVETNSSKTEVSRKNSKKSWEETFDKMLLSAEKTNQTSQLNKEEEGFIKSEKTSVNMNLNSALNTCSDLKDKKKSWEETFENMIFVTGQEKPTAKLNKENVKNENTSVSTNLISASNKCADKNNEPVCNYNRKTDFNENAGVTNERKVANESRNDFENFKIFKDRSTPDKKLDDKSIQQYNGQAKICKKFNFMADFESMLKTPKKDNENTSAQSTPTVKNIDTDISIKKFDIDKNKQTFKDDATKTVNDSKTFDYFDDFEALLKKRKADSCEKLKSDDRSKRTKADESPDNSKIINGAQLNTNQSKINSSDLTNSTTTEDKNSGTTQFKLIFEQLLKKR